MLCFIINFIVPFYQEQYAGANCWRTEKEDKKQPRVGLVIVFARHDHDQRTVAPAYPSHYLMIIEINADPLE